MDRLLSLIDIKNVLGHNINFISYDEIYKYKTIDELFDNSNQIVLFYINEKSHNTITGHWDLLLRHPTSIEFFDSYGLVPDKILNSFPKHLRITLGQPYNHLSRLMSKAKLPCEYNEIHYQGKDTNTCGRYLIVRYLLSFLSLKEYQALFDYLIKLTKKSPDELMVQLTEPLV